MQKNYTRAINIQYIIYSWLYFSLTLSWFCCVHIFHYVSSHMCTLQGFLPFSINEFFFLVGTRQQHSNHVNRAIHTPSNQRQILLIHIDACSNCMPCNRILTYIEIKKTIKNPLLSKRLNEINKQENGN